MGSFLLVLDVVTPLSAFMSALLLHHACFFPRETSSSFNP
jgi:hypothetical protein